jgi:transposase
MQAAESFASGASVAQVAAKARVSRQSGWRWQKTFEAGGVEALRSRGPHRKCRLSPDQVKALLAALEQGPAVHGWSEDQRWTLARICRLAQEMFTVGYTPKGMSLLLKRNGWSVQVPAVRAVERDEAAIATWRVEQWPIIKGQQGSWAPTSASRTSPGQG